MATSRHDVALCEHCGLPAVCIDADLLDPWFWCGQCCPTHDGNDAALAHASAEGIRIAASAPRGAVPQ